MKTHKSSTRPRTADTSIFSRENLLTLTHLIEDTGIDHRCPPSLGLFTSVTVTILYLEENIRQQVLATIFKVSQPTISRAITCILNVLDSVLPFPPTPKDLDPHRFYVLDGTLVECWGWKNHQKLRFSHQKNMNDIPNWVFMEPMGIRVVDQLTPLQNHSLKTIVIFLVRKPHYIAVNIRKLVSTCKYLPNKQGKFTTYPTRCQDQHMISMPYVRPTYLITFHPITSPLIKDISVLDATFPSAGSLKPTYKIGNNDLTKASNASTTSSNEQ